jgi:hypothetical protein
VSETSGILRLSAVWQAEVGRRAGRVMLGLFVLSVVLGAHLARVGTVPLRVSAAALMVVVVALSILRRRRERRSFMDPPSVIRRALTPADPEAAGRALRAHALVGATATDPSRGSPELAALHLHRVLAKVPLEAVRRAARGEASRLSWALLAVVVVTGVGLLFEPLRVIEGLDVLLARRGVAPLELGWLNLVRVSAQAPAYLKGGEQALFPALPSELPAGSVVSVRGVPDRKGRKLVLTNGTREVGFVDDGSGSVVARWKLDAPARLRIAARFGEVLIRESEELELDAIADQAPRVELEDAPRTVQLRDIESLDFRYLASDDHGLRQVDLVLRSGGREERRMLVRLDGQSRVERGAHALGARDAALRRMFLPVVATIEARDNDAMHPDKWGKSPAITIVPPSVGEPQALRYQALVEARGRLVALLDYELESERLRKEKPAPPDKARESERARLKSEAIASMRAAVTGAFAGARASAGLSAFVLGQARALEKRSADGRRRVEDVVLAFDAALRGLSARDAAQVSRRLGDVAEEAAEGAKLALIGEGRQQGRARLTAALTALDSGAKNLVTLGSLGADIGSVAQGDMGRIRRAEGLGSFSDAELAARHLAARLRRPSPSFSTAGGGGVESGRGAEGPGEPSEADRQFDQLMREIEQLASEHGEQIRSVESALKEGEAGAVEGDLKREASERAAQLRERLSSLPDPGAPPGSARSAAAVGREHMSAMAQQFERLALKDAVETGRRAASQLEEAARLARDPRSGGDFIDEQAVASASRELGEQLAWAERALERQKQQAAERASGALNDLATREEALARRAGNLAGRGEHSEAKLSEEVQEALEGAENAMRQAARELSSGRGDPGLEFQREAQRLLERANPGRTSDPDDEGQAKNQGDDHGNGDVSTRARVPAADKGRRAEDFRRRVLEGLSQERRGRLGGAVERYAEGLLE